MDLKPNDHFPRAGRPLNNAAHAWSRHQGVGPMIKCRRAFKCAAELQNGLFIKRATDDLQAQGQALGRKAGRHRNRRKARHVCGNGQNVVEIHRDGIITLLANAEARPAWLA